MPEKLNEHRDFNRSISFKYLEHKDFNKYKYTFNPSFLKFNNTNILTFRCNDNNTNIPDHTRFAFLDNNFNLIENSIFNPHPSNLFKSEDSRIFLYNNKLHMIYGDNGKMFIAFLNDNYKIYKTKSLKMLSQKRHEKNWNPFVFNDKLYFVYKPGPHHQVSTIIKENDSEIITKLTYNGKGIPLTQYGNEIKSNTPPILIDNVYYSFFHTSRWEKLILFPTNNIVNVLCYYTWFYGFEAFPPFNVKCISSSPVMSGDKRNFGNIWNKFVCVNFPVGSYYEKESGKWTVFSGEFDKKISISEFLHEDMLK